MFISEIDVNYESHLLHIGDRVLQINNISLEQMSFEDIKNAFENYVDQAIKLYVEHNPNHIKKLTKSLPKSNLDINLNGVLNHIKFENNNTQIVIDLDNDVSTTKDKTNFDFKHNDESNLNYTERPKSLCQNDSTNTIDENDRDSKSSGKNY